MSFGGREVHSLNLLEDRKGPLFPSLGLQSFLLPLSSFPGILGTAPFEIRKTPRTIRFPSAR